MPVDRKRRLGFTLIELLLVVAILAILISILLPALSGARVEGVKLKCLANLRTITQTAFAYAADDAKSVLGPVHPNASRFLAGTGYAEYGGGPGYAPYQNWTEDFDPGTRPLNHLIYGKRIGGAEPGNRAFFQPFQCPGEELGWQEWPGFGGMAVEVERPYFAANGTSFRMNNLAFTDGTVTGIYGRSQTRIPDPSNTLAFLEARVYQALFTNEVNGTLTPGELTSYHRRLGYFNVSYADGHASFADFGRNTFFPHLEQFGGKDYRGLWGRMDTFPEELLNPHRPPGTAPPPN
jgi:prepilin-type N-terminal cleavage/methylation domain-containing protein/prepilin-type processing-associated H-X9-DG protein